MNPTLYFASFTLLAFLLMALEVFLPGGVLGALGAVSLLAACGFAVTAFGPATGILLSLVMILGTLAAFMVWLVKLPETRIGRRISLKSDLHDSKSAPDEDRLVGQCGIAETDLRPSGFARVEGRRLDVVASRGFVEKGTAIVVSEVHGMRIVVRPRDEEAAS